MPDNVEKQLDRLRERIDEIDNRILELMGDRLKVAGSIAGIKRSLSEPAFYRPEREARLLRRLRTLKPTQLSGQDVESLFRTIMSITRNSEASMSVALLGPMGSPSTVAAKRHFGDSIELACVPTVADIIDSTECGKTDFALIPVEYCLELIGNAGINKLTGTSLLICAEVILPIRYHLLACSPSLEDIRMVVAPPHTLAACQHWLEQHIPKLQLIVSYSAAEAIQIAATSSDKAAIAPREADDGSGLFVLAENIQDEADKCARFVVLSPRNTPPSGHDRTTFILAAHHPAAMACVLKALTEHDVAVTQVASHPVCPNSEGEFRALIDVRGHREDAALLAAMKAIDVQGLFRCLGSYPVAF